MCLVASPLLSEEDIQAIQQGYQAREDIVTKALLQGIEATADPICEQRLGYLAWLIAEGRLDIKIAIPISEQKKLRAGIYHEKLGLFFDSQMNVIAFTGSPNETSGGLVGNFETIDVFWSWEDPQHRVQRKRENFERLWANQTAGLEVLDFPEAARQRLLKYRPKDLPDSDSAARQITPQESRRWRHQDEAVAAFLKAERGVLEMATGTGKTRTALRICERLFSEDAIETIVVAADGNDLLDQWHGQLLSLTKRLPRTVTMRRDYRGQREREHFLLEPGFTILLVSRPNLAGALKDLPLGTARRTLLIHDEVHRLGSPGNREALDGLSDRIRFRLGLSATPEREYDDVGNDFVEGHVGPVVFQFGLDDAIRRQILAPFTYFPLSYSPSTEDGMRLQQVYKQAAARQAAGNPMTQEEIWIELARVYKTSKAKLPIFADFIGSHQSLLARCIIFVETKEYGDEVLHIVHRHRHDFHTYYAEEDSSTLKRFAAGEIECLITCHRLSEGIDIQSLTTVILFSSARARLETIQRMGRCLRADPANPNKRANVVDFIRLPNPDTPDNSDEERRDWLLQLSDVAPDKDQA